MIEGFFDDTILRLVAPHRAAGMRSWRVRRAPGARQGCRDARACATAWSRRFCQL